MRRCIQCILTSDVNLLFFFNHFVVLYHLPIPILSAHIKDLCFANPQAVVPHPSNCAQYFDCSQVSTSFGHYLMECAYPMLFDESTLSCRDFNQVQCGTKREPLAPCEYSSEGNLHGSCYNVFDTDYSVIFVLFSGRSFNS